MIRSTGIVLMSAVVMICCLGVAFALPTPDDMSPSIANWQNFKSKFKKNYVNDADDKIRRDTWKGKLNKINQHNLEEKKTGKHGYTVGVNQFTDMLDNEVKRTLGYKGIAKRSKRQAVYMPNSTLTSSLPASVNWTAKGLVNPVQDQGYCGSCWAFSANGALEGQYFKKYNKSAILSEQNLVDCSSSEGNLGCDGGNMVYAYEFVQLQGIGSTTVYPYTTTTYLGMTGTCKYSVANNVTGLSSWQNIDSDSEPALQQAVALVGPVAAAVDASDDTFQAYSGGVYNNPNCTTEVNHGILVVGYGTYNSQPYWLIKNSWGTGWGIQGYMMMARNANNMCSIAVDASFPNI